MQDLKLSMAEIAFLSELIEDKVILDGLNKKKYNDKFDKFLHKLSSKLRKIRFKH